MKLLQIILLISLTFSSLAQDNDKPAELAKAVAEKMKKVENYSADVLIKVDVDFVKIEERRAQVFFEQPDKFDIKAKGIALIPKKGTEMEYLQLLNSDFTAIFEKTEVIDGITTQVIKVIPLGSDSDVVLAQLWIDEENLRIERMQTFTRSSGAYLVDFSYSDHIFDLPASIRVEFDVRNMSLPASMTGDLESMAKKLEKKEITKGVIVMEYSNYKVNYL